LLKLGWQTDGTEIERLVSRRRRTLREFLEDP
jgi:hypothetical protein